MRYNRKIKDACFFVHWYRFILYRANSPHNRYFGKVLTSTSETISVQNLKTSEIDFIDIYKVIFFLRKKLSKYGYHYDQCNISKFQAKKSEQNWLLNYEALVYDSLRLPIFEMIMPSTPFAMCSVMLYNISHPNFGPNFLE